MPSRCPDAAPNDWMEHIDMLPDRPMSLVEERFSLLFALDVQSRPMHDMYVAMLPNQVCMVGLAPSHPLIQRHRSKQASGEPSLSSMEAVVASLEDPGLPMNAHSTSQKEELTSLEKNHGINRQDMPQHDVHNHDRECVNEPAMKFVDSFPVSRLKTVNFDVDLRPGHSRLDIKESGR